MNGTAYNQPTQTLNIPYTLIQPVIPCKQLAYETPEQLAIRHYEDFILSIMKVIDLQYITHCTNEEYRLITIHRAGETLIHTVPMIVIETILYVSLLLLQFGKITLSYYILDCHNKDSIHKVKGFDQLTDIYILW